VINLFPLPPPVPRFPSAYVECIKRVIVRRLTTKKSFYDLKALQIMRYMQFLSGFAELQRKRKIEHFSTNNHCKSKSFDVFEKVSSRSHRKDHCWPIYFGPACWHTAFDETLKLSLSISQRHVKQVIEHLFVGGGGTQIEQRRPPTLISFHLLNRGNSPHLEPSLGFLNERKSLAFHLYHVVVRWYLSCIAPKGALGDSLGF